MKRVICFYPGWLLLLCILPQAATGSEDRYSLNVYGAVVTENKFEDFLLLNEGIRTMDSGLLAVSLAKPVGPRYGDLNFEVEGQLVRHFGLQNHWEFNALTSARWDALFWDRFIDSSVAFGLGASYATKTPKAEIRIESESAQWMVYWMLEFAFELPRMKNISLITRLHHRSEAFGWVADNGGSNAVGLGIKFRFPP